MRTVERDIDRILTVLRNRIRERGFTQLEVQENLGWGPSYISQILTRQKTLRIDQVLMILNVIDVEPDDFWGEVYKFGKFSEETHSPGRRGPRAAPSAPGALDGATLLADLHRLKRLLDSVLTVLTQHLVSPHDLDDATRRFRQDAS